TARAAATTRRTRISSSAFTETEIYISGPSSSGARRRLRHPGDVAGGVDADRPVRAGAVLGRLRARVVAGVALADGDGARGTLDEDAAERRRVVVVRVHADERGRRAARHHHHVLQLHVARVLGVAIAARSIQLAEVLRAEVPDNHRARSVVLE